MQEAGPETTLQGSCDVASPVEPQHHTAASAVAVFWGPAPRASLQPPAAFELLCCIQGLPSAAAKGNSLAKRNVFIIEVIRLMAFNVTSCLMVLLPHSDRRDVARSSGWKMKLDRWNLVLGGNG